MVLGQECCGATETEKTPQRNPGEEKSKARVGSLAHTPHTECTVKILFDHKSCFSHLECGRVRAGVPASPMASALMREGKILLQHVRDFHFPLAFFPCYCCLFCSPDPYLYLCSSVVPRQHKVLYLLYLPRPVPVLAFLPDFDFG